MFPSIAKYNHTILTKGGNAFKTLSNLNFIVSRKVPVKIYSYGSGSYAVVFRAKDNYSEYAIRCFISADEENISRYRIINNYFKNLNASWITKIELLEDEINIDSKNYPVIKMDWVEGELLNNYVNHVLDNNSALSELQNEVISVSKSLESLKIGHGDIQCGNIIIAKNTAGKNIIKLIDYDGIYIPPFSNKINLENGRTEFQHPNRSQIQYNEKIDRFSFWVILTALEALKFDKTLWFEVMQGGFNTLDNLLFIGSDFKYFNNSKLVNRLYTLNKPSLNFYLDNLNKFCNSSPESIEFPRIYESALKEIKQSEEQSEAKNSDTTKVVQIITNPSGAIVLTSTFQRIGTTPLKIDLDFFNKKTLIVSYKTQIKQVEISENQKVIDITFLDEKKTNGANQFPKQTIKYPPVNDTVSPTPIQSKQLGNKPKDSDWSFLIAVFLFLSVIGFLIIFKKENELPKSNFSADSITVDSMPSNNEEPPPIEELKVVDLGQETIEGDSKDDLGQTPQEVIQAFLDLLSFRKFELAWYNTLNPTWENKGKDWFCSNEGFGGISKLVMFSINLDSQSSTEAEASVNYYTEDINNGNLCYNQIIKVEKFTFDDNTTRWMITKIKNTKAPYSCELTN
jgi:hypothetical protein